MISYSKVTDIFCVIDKFCQEYNQIVDKALLDNPSKRLCSICKSGIITIAVLFHLGGFMKNSLMTISDKILLRKRSVIETVNDERSRV